MRTIRLSSTVFCFLERMKGCIQTGLTYLRVSRLKLKQFEILSRCPYSLILKEITLTCREKLINSVFFQAATDCSREFETIFTVYQVEIKIPRGEGSKHKSNSYKINLSLRFRLNAQYFAQYFAVEHYYEKMRSIAALFSCRGVHC